ncbi:MAG: hypothetical protein LBK07_00580 [Tannerella sp.]|jgi:hypothetical protein|nr:hypothetical protein [Tannerella sp.]
MEMKHFKSTVIAFFVLVSAQWLAAQTPAQLKLWLVDVPGWTLSDETEVFDPDNLFDRINGAAPLFIENNFVEMTSLEYKKGDDYITIQAYRHATSEDAFGMYASERSDELAHFDIGGEAQGDAKDLFFFAGSIYVKMWSNSSDDVEAALHAIGKGLAGRIDGGATYPVVARQFPAKGKRAWSESYVTKGYIGHEFLKSVYVAKYESEGQPFQLFVVDGKTKDGARKVLDSYIEFTGQPAVAEEGRLTIGDRYNGDIPFVWKGRYLIGVYNENGETVKNAGEWLTEMAEKLD